MKKQTGFIELILILIFVSVVIVGLFVFFFAKPLAPWFLARIPNQFVNTKQLIYKNFVYAPPPKLNNPPVGNGGDYKLRVGWNLIYLPYDGSVTSKLDNPKCSIELVSTVKLITRPDVNKISQVVDVMTGGKFYLIQCKEPIEFSIIGQPSIVFPKATDGWQLVGLPKGTKMSAANFLTWAQTTNDTLSCSEVDSLSSDKSLVKMSQADQISDQTGYWLYCTKRT